ncbi:protein hunchback isoform X2 [Zootermopsis nevadensis]|nr:protein hunchback isoform X2 [Zootermopsis nevadensis]
MDTEHRSHSPNDDSGISPGSSSVGRPSPGQSGSFGSPEHFGVQENQGIKSELNTESNTSSSQCPHSQQRTNQNMWGINPLQHSHDQYIVSASLKTAASNTNLERSILKPVPQTSVSEADHPHQQQNTSPSSRIHVTQTHTPSTSPLQILNSMANRSPVISQITASPSRCTQSPMFDSPVRILSHNTKTPPIANTNALPGLNSSLSDDNSRSSTSSSTMMVDGGNEYFKMTLPEGEQYPLRCLEMAVEQSSIMGGMRGDGEAASGTGAGNNGVRNIYQCPLCDYTTLSRIDFNDHNRIHCPDQKCTKCDFVTKDVVELETHLRENHMISPGLAEQMIEAKEEQSGIRVPRVNSQGKVKTFRCKQCAFVAITKMEFWNHSRCHIKKEKMLNCPRCPFVTEYKHHLEYHLRNHVNSKPFQCLHCSYTCVNKSMLNSHLKSHSNVCQYRCATCDYATKYLHSLKVHLRKYKHSPATVLNPDGTPNPYPIIDVYGTRRGPKQRPRNTMKSTSKENNDIPLPSHAPLPLPLFQPSYGVISQQSGKLPIPYPYGCTIPNAFSTNKNNNNNHNSLLPAFPHNGIMNTEDKGSDDSDSKRNSSDENYDHFLVATSQYYHMNNNTIINNNNNSVSDSNAMKETTPEKSLQKQHSDETIRLSTGEHVQFLNRTVDPLDPLDLSKPEAMVVSPEASAMPSVLQKSTLMKAAKHRRKGQAYKLDHISRKLQQASFSDNKGENKNYSRVSESQEKPSSPDRTDHLTNTDITLEGNIQRKQQPESELMKVNEDLSKGKAEDKSTQENNSASGNSSEVYHCIYCDITFNDVVLYSMHRGYHGYQDPFKCNMCGTQTANKVDFFLHIARSSHS